MGLFEYITNTKAFTNPTFANNKAAIAEQNFSFSKTKTLSTPSVAAVLISLARAHLSSDSTKIK